MIMKIRVIIHIFECIKMQNIPLYHSDARSDTGALIDVQKSTCPSVIIRTLNNLTREKSKRRNIQETKKHDKKP